jgi:hypothetical protein
MLIDPARLNDGCGVEETLKQNQAGTGVSWELQTVVQQRKDREG